MGRDDWPRYIALWHSFIEKNESDSHLQENEKSSSPFPPFRAQQLESTVRYLGIEVADVLLMAEQTEV